MQEAANGEAAIAVFEDWRPHLIWMDMRMPVMDGYTAARRLRALPGGEAVKIVAVTASAFEEQREEILASGCDDLVRKPFREHKIFEAMARLLDVEYVYELTGQEPARARGTDLTAEMLADLPLDLRQELDETTLALNREATLEVIERIGEQAPDTARGLRALVEGFQMGRIRGTVGGNGQEKWLKTKIRYPEAADILVVDDTIASLRLLTEILGKGGYRVRPADEPHLALQSALAQPPSLILLDVRMPGMDGFEVCRRLKQDERTRDVPIIFVSALHDVDDRVQGFEVGGVDFVSKPIEEAEVLARVKTHLLLWTMQLHLEELVAERTAELVQTNEALLSEIAERKRAEEALQQSEERHRLLFENASLGIGYYTPDGRVIAFNKVAAEQLNGKPEDYVGRSLSDLFGPEAGAVYAERIETACGSPESLEFEDHVSLQSGDNWFLATYNRIANASDQIVGVQIISNDITERKQAEEALKESEERFRSLVEQSPISIQIHAPDGRLVQSNAAYARLYALNREALAELYEKYNVLQDEQAKRLGIMPFIEGTFAGEEVVFPPYEYDGIDTLKTLDFDNPISRRCWVQTRGFPLRGQDGRVASFVFMSEDITERKQGEEALRESEARYRSLVEQAQDGIAVLQDGKVRFANSYIAGLSGRTVEELLDTPFEAYLTVDQRPKIADIYRRRMNGEAVSSIYESAIEHRDGSRVEVEFNAGLTTYEGKPADLVIVRDITERRKAKSALRESEEKLRAIYEAIPVATYTWQREGEDFVLVDYNEMAAKITEGRIVDLVGERASEMYRDLPEIPEAMTRCSSERLTIEEEMDYHLITTGRRRHLNVKYAFAPPDLVVVHTEDITARKRVEEELRKSNERLEEAQRTAQIGDWEYDILAGKVTWSDEMYRICGVDPEQYVPTAKSDEEFCHPDDVPALREAYERFFAGGEPLDLDYRIVTPQGVVKACRRRGRLIVDDRGHSFSGHRHDRRHHRALARGTADLGVPTATADVGLPVDHLRGAGAAPHRPRAAR